MFLDLFKNLSLKKIVKNYLSKTSVPSDRIIKSIGLIVDGTRFNETEALLKEFSNYGINQNDIKTIVFTKNKNSENNEYIKYFRSKDISSSGNILNEDVKSFSEKSFDLLINYYDKQQVNLTYLTVKSKSDFKVGFTMEEKRFNHFMIDVPISDYKLFTEELFKYLKVLNKI